MPDLSKNPEAFPSVVAFVKDPVSDDAIKQALKGGGANIRVVQGDVKTATAHLSREPSPSLLIVDLSNVDEPVNRIRDLAEVCEPNLHVIAIGDLNDIVLYRDLKKAGVSEYFVKPLVQGVLSRTCKAILMPESQESESTSRSGKLIFTLGVRGGVGSTTIAANMAWHFAEVRKRSTILVDLDISDGDLGLQFNVNANRTLLEALTYPERVDKLFLERGVSKLNDRLDVLFCLEDFDSPPIGSIAVKSLLEKLLAKYRFVVVDLPRHVASSVWPEIVLTGSCVIVGDASLASARDMDRWNAYIKQKAQRFGIINVLNERSRNAMTAAEFEQAAGCKPDFAIAHDKDLPRAAVLGVEAMHKCQTFNRGLQPIVQHFTGEGAAKPKSAMRRMFA